MKISVVIPLYNKERTIGRAIDSVLSQSHDDFELIVIDDGSEDGSVDKVLERRDVRIKLVRQANSGVSAARNVGVRTASHDWIAFLDADDAYRHHFLSKCIVALKEYTVGEVSFVACNYLITKGIEPENTRMAFGNKIKSGENNYFELSEGSLTPACCSSVIVSKDKFNQVGGFPVGIKYFEDWILWLKLALCGKFLFISEPLSNVYRDEFGVSSFHNISTAELYRCTLSFICNAEKSLSDKFISLDLSNLAYYYLDSFIVSQAHVLARLNANLLSMKLLSKIKISHVNQSLIPAIIHTIALVARNKIMSTSVNH